MNSNLIISGFADEISNDLSEQLRVLKKLGMNYLSLRGVDGKNIGEYDLEEIRTNIKPQLEEAGIRVSSIGSPIGKVKIDDVIGFEKQKLQLETLCQACKEFDCKYIRVFSFYIPEGKNPDDYKETVISNLKQFVAIAKKYDVILLHENEKDIFGDIARRCKELFDEIASENFKGIFDFANFVQCGEDTEKSYDLLRNDIYYIHIKDAVYTENENVVCGTGDGKIPELLNRFIKSGYKGFLTLEPHLVLFDSLKDLEIKDSSDVIKDNKGMTNEEGFTLQYTSLKSILSKIV